MILYTVFVAAMTLLARALAVDAVRRWRRRGSRIELPRVTRANRWRVP